MNGNKTSRRIKGLGLCSGGLDSILSALILKRQDIYTTWICFETPFFSADSAKKAAQMTGIPLVVKDITDVYMQMMKNPKAGFGKNMNPCMDCHALMFKEAGKFMESEGFDFLFSGEVVGQRPKSQNKNSLRYVEKNSGYDGLILRPLCAKRLPVTKIEEMGLVDREQLMDITGRSRKIQMQLAEAFGIKEYPSPAGGCLLTDPVFSIRLKELMDCQNNPTADQLHLLKYGRHFRIDPCTKVIVGRNKSDNRHLSRYFNPQKDVLIKHDKLPGPDVILTGEISEESIRAAALICAAYSRGDRGSLTPVRYQNKHMSEIVHVAAEDKQKFKSSLIK